MDVKPPYFQVIFIVRRELVEDQLSRTFRPNQNDLKQKETRLNASLKIKLMPFVNWFVVTRSYIRRNFTPMDFNQSINTVFPQSGYSRKEQRHNVLLYFPQENQQTEPERGWNRYSLN